MCRLLLVVDPGGGDPNPCLDAFRDMSRNSREYQGHGWGCTWLDDDNTWRMHHDIKPVWEDTEFKAPPSRVFMAHARSAFRDEGIAVENNMPFSDGSRVFIFNGELQGVRIKAEGRIGAEKIFNYVKRFDKGDLGDAVEKGAGVIERRTRYVRAMNFMLADSERLHLCSLFGEDPEYFQMRETRIGDKLIIASEPIALPTQADWLPIANHSFKHIDLP